MQRELAEEIRKSLKGIPIDFGGGCSLAKGLVLADLVVCHRLLVSVDIGVYRGRSLFPLAVAHRRSGGMAYGVDPWNPDEARQYDRPDLQEALDKFARETDFEAIYQRVQELRTSLGLSDSCQLLRMRSDEAVNFFDREGICFGLVHVDGNHDAALVSSDVQLYYPRLVEGGFLVLDDISWDSVAPALRFADSAMTLVFARSDDEADYAVYQKASSGRSSRGLTRRLRRIEEEGRRVTNKESRA